MSVASKLRLTANSVITLINGPANYAEIVGDLPEGVKIEHQMSRNHPFIHLFVKNRAELEANIDFAIKSSMPKGLIWISYPKGTSGIQTDLTRDKGWEILLNYDWQWASLISLDETWSAFLIKNEPAKQQTKASKDYHANQNEWCDPKTKTVKVPEEVQRALDKNPGALRAYNALNYTNRKEYVMWFVTAKTEETRLKRLNLSIEKLEAGKKNPAEK